MTATLSQTVPARFWRAAVGSELRRNVVETYGARVLVFCISLATSIVIARMLGPEGRGLYAAAAAVAAIGIQVGNIGLHAANTYHVARERRLLSSLIGNTLVVSFAFGLLAALAAVILASFWPHLAPVNGWLLVLTVVWIPFGLGYLLLQSLLLGIDRVRRYNVVEVAGKALALIFIVALALSGFRAVYVLFAATVLANIFSFGWCLLELSPVSTSRPQVSRDVFQMTIGVGIKAYLVAVFGFLVLRIDLLMVKYLLGSSQAGYYSISQTMAENASLFPVVVGTVLFPKLSATSDQLTKLRLTGKAALATAGLLLPLLALASLFATPVVSLAFGKQFLPAVPAFVWLMPGTFFLGIEVVLVQFLNSLGFPTVVIWAWVADAILNIAVNLWAIPRYGITGASVVSSVSYFLIFAAVAAIVWKHANAARSNVALAA